MNKNNNIIKLLDPTPRVCPGRQPPRFLPAGSEFIRDVVRNIKKPFEACTVDGYIVNPLGDITRIFCKREFKVLQQEATAANIREGIVQIVNGESFLETKLAFKSVAKLLGCGLDLLFSPVGYPYTAAPEAKMFLISVDDVDSGRAKVRALNCEQLADHIRRYRGRSFIKSKPLTVATSGIECYLANELIRDGCVDPFPGDLDFILLEGGRARVIAEFKTHNLDFPIADESFFRYQNEDWRRLDVLLSLSGQLCCKLFYVFWGPRHQEVKVQEIIPDRTVGESFLLNKSAEGLAEFFEHNARG